MAGVQRRMLDRIGDEVARATSIVRYARGSSFAAHVHDLGEEFLVLEGTFTDETGDFPVGTYSRHPPGSQHAPSSKDGCVILVKLRQFDPADAQWVRTNTQQEAWLPGACGRDHQVLPLFSRGSESVAMVSPGAEPVADVYPGGLELLVLAGRIRVNGTSLAESTWARFPATAELTISGAGKTWMKAGHLKAHGEVTPQLLSVRS